jgi:hypothetical protein
MIKESVVPTLCVRFTIRKALDFSIIILLAEEVGGINYDWQLAGPPGAPRVFTLKGALGVHFRGRAWPWN